jgi:hypothetical protein
MADQPRPLLPALGAQPRRLLPALGLGPAEQSSPEDPNEPPDQDGIFSRPPELTVLAMTGAYLSALLVPNDDTVLRREGTQDLKLFDTLLDDDVAMSNMQQRRLAITSKDWEVVPGDDKDPRSVQAAEEFKAMLQALGFGAWSSFGGEPVPPNKFLTIRTGGTHDFAFYGLGLAHWCYWPIWFKRAGNKFWALYLEKLANPTAIGPFTDADGDKEKNKLVQTLLAIGRDSAVIVPKDILDQIKFMEAQRPGISSASYKDFVTEQNEAVMRIVLGQPGTSKATP